MLCKRREGRSPKLGGGVRRCARKPNSSSCCCCCSPHPNNTLLLHRIPNSTLLLARISTVSPRIALRHKIIEFVFLFFKPSKVSQITNLQICFNNNKHTTNLDCMCVFLFAAPPPKQHTFTIPRIPKQRNCTT